MGEVKLSKDLKWIKKHYGEDMMHLCRSLFPTILGYEGVLPRILDAHFDHSKSWIKEILSKVDAENMFKNYICFLAEPILKELRQKDNQAEERLSAAELLDKAGYILYPECKTQDEVMSFRRWWAPNEELCTFRAHRLETARVWFAVKKNAHEIKRENFKNPLRQDEYGTSVISIQFARFDSSLSIKNRYNHTVENCDCTFSNDLDNIIAGLTDAFERDYDLKHFVKSNSQEIVDMLGGVCVDGKAYHCNLTIGDVHFCDNNIIIDDGRVIKLPDHQILVDNFIFDLKNKTIKSYDKISDNFPETFGEIESITRVGKVITIKAKDKQDVVVKLNDHNQIVYLSNPNLTKCDWFFLGYNTVLEELYLPNVTECGNYFLCGNKSLKKLYLPKLEVCREFFLYKNTDLEELDLPNLTKCGAEFLCRNRALKKINLPKLTECLNGFLEDNVSLRELDLPNLTKCGAKFLCRNRALKKINLPKLTEWESDFLQMNKIFREYMSSRMESHSTTQPEHAIAAAAQLMGVVKEQKNLVKNSTKTKE